MYIYINIFGILNQKRSKDVQLLGILREWFKTYRLESTYKYNTVQVGKKYH